jgi:hypothetical protein
MATKRQNKTTIEKSIPIGYLRTPSALEKLSVRLADQFDDIEANRYESLADLKPFATLERIPISARIADPKAKQLLMAWDALSAVRVPTPEAADALRTILTETAPASSIPAPRPFPFAELAAPEPSKPTAAHPRAFRGTTYKPPKGKSPAVADLRLYLSDQEAIRDLGMRLFPSDTFNTDSPSSAFHNSMTPDLSPIFIAILYPNVRHHSTNEIAAAHALFQRLGLERNEPLLACVAALFASSQYAPKWCEIMALLPPDQQAGFAGLLLETDACDVDPGWQADGLIEILLDAANSSQSAYRIYCLLEGMSLGASARYLHEGFRLNDRLKTNSSFHDVIGGEDFPAETMHTILDRLGPTDSDDAIFDRWKFIHIWEACGNHKGLAALIAERDWSRWRPDVLTALLYFYSLYTLCDNYQESQKKWPDVRAYADDLEAILEKTPPDYQWKLVDSLETFVWLTRPEDWGQRLLPDACALLACLCRSPLDLRRDTAQVWMEFIVYFDHSQKAALLAAPQSCFQHLEKSCRTNNERNLIGYGTHAIAQTMPMFTLSCFLKAPSRFFRATKTLGCLSNAERLSFAKAFASEPFMERGIDEMNDQDAYELIASQEQNVLIQAIPKELTRHYGGGATLSEVRAAHYHALMRRQWLRACLELLENKIYERLAQGYPVEELDENTKHALQIQMKAKENRQALKKMLTAHWAGRRNYLIDHPKTQAWLRTHPKLNTDVWLTGVLYARTLAPYGEVAISVEQDPVEALKLGTYVGSCLGLGGSFAFSAAATVLDINKQVLYARDSKGAVLARQVVVYAESDDLLCYYVYPLSAPDSLRRLFAEYDRKFAAALGVPLFQESDVEGGEYRVEMILSHGWWDDYLDHDDYRKSKSDDHNLTPSP